MKYEFQNLSGVQPVDLSTEFHFVGTGMLRDYDLGWMSTAPRRDFGSGVSGSHLAIQFDTCLAELKLADPYPADSYHVMLTGSLRLLDLRKVADANFSGAYYSDDRSISCQIVDANRDYLKSGCFDGILRYSKPLVDVDSFQDVVALTPDAIGKLGVKTIVPLGAISKPLNVILSDGKVIPMVNYYPTA
jgi:hypothetical protein